MEKSSRLFTSRTIVFKEGKKWQKEFRSLSFVFLGVF